MKTLLILIVLLMSSSAKAGWINLGKGYNHDNTFTNYVDTTTIRKTGNIARMWDLMDFETTQKISNKGANILFRSSKTQSEYNCKKKQQRQLYMSLYTENLGKGEVVLTDNNHTKWEPIPTGSSAAEALWKLACEKR
jgi:Surface-adhesin protein E